MGWNGILSSEGPSNPLARMLMGWGDVGSAMPESYGAGAPIMDPLAKALIATATLPKRAVDAAKTDTAYYQQNGMDLNYEPQTIGPALEAATLPMGTGAIAGVPIRAGESVLGAGPIRAYHGSPHNFDTFDMSKIGTGEGAQAFGHGLYFAEAEPTALSYRDALTEPGKSGHMYEVNINADPEHFLDWDKPLKDQPHILNAAQNMGPDVAKRVMREKFSRGKQFNDIVANEGLPLGQATDANISAAMRNAGIPGIKYLDQGSRATGQGTRNYVVFDDRLIDVLRKYGLAGILPMGGIYGLASSQDNGS